LALLWFLFASGPALAHDALLGSTPASGARVTGASLGGHVVLHYEEPPLAVGAQVRVTGPTGAVSTGQPTIHGSDLVQPLATSIPAGAYTVTWRITADDGHVVSGTIPFTVTEGTAGPPAANPARPADPAPAAKSTGSGWTVIGAVAVLVVVVIAVLMLVGQRRRAQAGR
jgi:methionine-rich copper-binding protein CopC